MNNSHYVTPEEADKKFCPMSMSSELTHWCAGPKCMAWRWADVWEETGGNLREREIRYSTTLGYCGMVQP